MTSPATGQGGSRPSVAIVSCRRFDLLRRAVAALEDDCRRHGAELVIARAGGPDEAARVRAAFPHARVVEAPPDAGVPRLRGLALAAATGHPVLMLEDHCRPDSGWMDRLVAEVRGGADVVGGGMANAPGSGVTAWAAYLADYGFYSVARPSGRPGPPLLTAASIAYGRPVVAEAASWSLEGAWENVVHDRLAKRGAVLRFAPDARMYHDHQYRLGAFWRDRYDHGWDYARARLTEEGTARRWFHLVVAPLLPLVLLGRIARAAAGEDSGAFLRAFPATLFLLYGWAAGEAAGYIRGPLREGEEAGRVAAS